MTTLTEAPRTGEFIIAELPNYMSRQQVTVAANEGALPAGRVMAQVITAQTVASAAKPGGNTGNGTFTLDATTPLLPGAKLGVYRLRLVATAANNGTFRLEDPDGRVLGDIVMAAGAGAVAEQIQGALADGSTDFVVGDGFDITVSAITFNWVRHNPAGTNGSQFAAGILYAALPSSAAAQQGVVVHKDADVNSGVLSWTSGITAAQRALAAQQLADRGIRVRN